MAQTAKLFLNGRSQAVRLPLEFRFEGEEVRIRRDARTGDVILSPMARPLSTWLALRERLRREAPEELEGFDLDRDTSPPPERD